MARVEDPIEPQDPPPYSSDDPVRESRAFVPAVVTSMALTWAAILVALTIWIA